MTEKSIVRTIYEELDIINSIIKKHLCKMFPELAEYEIVANTDFEVVLDKYTEVKPKLCWAPVVSERDAHSFSEFCLHMNHNINADIFLLCFFHEIGHIKTQEIFYPDDPDSIIMKKYDYWDPFYYYMAPVEFMATRWGLDYMESHQQEVAEFWNELRPELIKFSTEIEED